MSKLKKGTKSSKRYRYSSFKDKIDNLRIEPARNLEKKVHDHVESSHFLSSFEHWVDINMSADFGTFANEVQPLVQTLPQILYHQEKIFHLLIDHINNHDEKSLHPLLDLLAQFCHDLGPDYMKYYEDSILALTNLLDDAINFESSDVFEWGFTSLAYIFKYLSRILTQDLKPTFNLLFPLLSHPKEYLSRFSAEALSFLIRKAKIKGLSIFVTDSLQKLEHSPEAHYYDGLRVLFVESLTTTSESLYSRSNSILRIFLIESLKESQKDICISLVADVLLDILRHASKDNARSVYELFISTLDDYLKETPDLDKVSKIILTLIFAESGTKVPDWSSLVSLMRKVVQHDDKSTLKPGTTSLLFSIFIRNAPLPSLTQFHRTIFDFFITQFSSDFLEFCEISLNLAKDRVLSLSVVKYLQKYINLYWKDNAKKIAFFLFELDQKPDLEGKLELSIPSDFHDYLINATELLSSSPSESDLYEIYWRLPILKRSNEADLGFISHLIKTMLSNSQSISEVSDFQKDVLGYLLQVMQLKEDHDDENILTLLMDKFQIYQNSVLFIRSLNRIMTIYAKQNPTKFSCSEEFLLSITDNFALPDGNIRYESLKLLITTLNGLGEAYSPIIDQCKVIEEIPHNLQFARDLTMRIRQMGSEFSKTQPDTLLCNAFFKFLFGMLTVRFSPLWEGVYEILPSVYEKDPTLIWQLLLKFLGALDNNFVLHYYEEIELEDVPHVFWEVNTARFNDCLKHGKGIFYSFNHIKACILEKSKERRGDLSFPGLIRNQTLKTMLLLPGLAERNSRDIVPYLLAQDDSENNSEDSNSNGSYWTDTDKNLLLKLIGKFKNIKAIYRSSDVYDRLMVLLESRTTDVQKLALDAILAYKETIAIKYKDNLKNLLDDTLFKDEIIKLLSKGSERYVEDGDQEELMPFVLRILFGRAQTPSTSGLKKSRKTAVVTILPNLEEKYVIQFLNLGSGRFAYSHHFEGSCNFTDEKFDSSELTITAMRKMTGFVNLVQSMLSILGTKFPKATETTVNPILYAIAASDQALTINHEQEFITKVASNLRQSAVKCLYSLFSSAGDLNWLNHTTDVFRIVVQPRLEHFERENLQQPSSLMKIMTYWGSEKHLYEFLYCDNFAPVSALMSTLANDLAKESVVEVILKFSNDVIKSPVNGDSYVHLVSIIASACLQALPKLFKRLASHSATSVAIDLLLNMTTAGYVENSETIGLLIESLTQALDKEFSSLHSRERTKILKSLASLINEYNCSWEEIEELYKVCSRLYRVYAERDSRESLNDIFISMGSRFDNIKQVATLLVNLNSYSSGRLESYDFERVLPAFKEIHEIYFKAFTEIEWLPILHCCLFYINDIEELALRTNATHTLNRFVDYINLKPTHHEAINAINLLETDVLPYVKSGIRRQNEEIQSEYISVVAYIVSNSNHYKGLDDMKVLLFSGDEEANFFVNISHIQIHRRQRAIRRLGEHASQLSDNSISHYLIPMIEHYVFCSDEKYRNICNETIAAIGQLSNFTSWNQYKALSRRYVSLLNTKKEFLKELVWLIVEISKALKNSMISKRENDDSKPCIRKFPKKLEEPSAYIKDELYVKLSKFLATRNEETIVARIPLSEALVNLILGLCHEDRISHLPGILTSICQVLRSKSEELREAVRKNLGNISILLGAEYLTFIITELKSALKRGSQIHVLSYTIHYVIMSVSDVLKHGDLDPSAQMIVDVVMEDIFGAAGQEKDAENYKSKMKEVKFNKSYDTGEILASNISLPVFGTALRPIKALLMQHLALRTQNKLDELLRRYALGLTHNDEASSTDILTLCYEVYKQSEALSNRDMKKSNLIKEQKNEFFLINLNAQDGKVETENSLFASTLQKFALDLLKAILTRKSNLLSPAYLNGFIPILQDTLNSENEGVLISTLRVLIIFIKLDFPSESEGLFKNCARKVLNLIRDSPTTSTELCQVCLKYLSSLIRHRDIQLKDTALSYVLGRIQPDLNEPNKQGLAFSFLKALLAKHIILPELYDIIDSVASIMVTNHSKEIRDVSRSVYYQFLMEYDQSRGRLEKQFKFLVSNLEYPSQEGRQSVMELINLIINKCGPELLLRLSSSFFLALANVTVNDDSPKCREMAVALLTQLFQKLGPSNIGDIEKYIIAWLKQEEELMFVSLGLRIYKIYFMTLGWKNEDILSELAMTRTKAIISNTDAGSDSEWDLVYTALTIFTTYADKYELAFADNFSNTWTSIVKCLLYPHPWVRLAAGRLVNRLISNLNKLESSLSDTEIQTIAFRIFRQLGAPYLPESLSSVSVKTLAMIFMKWKENNTKFVVTDELEATSYQTAIDFAIARTGFIIRNEENLEESFMSKKTCIQLFALLVQILDLEQLREKAERIILPLFVYLENDKRGDDKVSELQDLSQECLQLLESKLAVSDFTRAYSQVKQQVDRRRQERRAKRAVLAVTAPEAAANRKLKKHARSRQKRKHEKDENGYYRQKNKKRRA